MRGNVDELELREPEPSPEVRRIKGGLLWGILATALLGWILGVTPWPEGIIAPPPVLANLFGQAVIGVSLGVWICRFFRGCSSHCIVWSHPTIHLLLLSLYFYANPLKGGG